MEHYEKISLALRAANAVNGQNGSRTLRALREAGFSAQPNSSNKEIIELLAYGLQASMNEQAARIAELEALLEIALITVCRYAGSASTHPTDKEQEALREQTEPVPVAVPDEITEAPGSWKTPDYVAGWNDYRTAMLAATPKDGRS